MPNYCDNDLYIEGSEYEIKRFLNIVKDDKYDDILIDNEKLVPYPKEMKDDERHHWRLENWGTNGGYEKFFEPKIFRKYTKVRFLSPWSSPIQIIKKMGEMFPNLTLTLRYYEFGVGFQGVYKVKGCNLLQDETSKYIGKRGG